MRWEAGGWRAPPASSSTQDEVAKSHRQPRPTHTFELVRAQDEDGGIPPPSSSFSHFPAGRSGGAVAGEDSWWGRSAMDVRGSRGAAMLLPLS